MSQAPSSRNLVRVQWPGGVANSYRLGLDGKVDLKCVEEGVGPFYYRDHLPLLGELSYRPCLLYTSDAADER